MAIFKFSVRMTLARCVRCWDPGPVDPLRIGCRGLPPLLLPGFTHPHQLLLPGRLPLQGGQLRDPLEEGVRGPRHGVRERPLTWGAGEGAGGRERWRKGTRGWGWGV